MPQDLFMRIHSGWTVASTDLRSCFFLLCIFLTYGLWYAFYLFHTALLPLSYDDLTTFSFDFSFFQTTRNCNCIVRDAIFRVPTSLFLIL